MKWWKSYFYFFENNYRALLVFIPFFVGFVLLINIDKITNTIILIWPKERANSLIIGLVFIIWSISFVIMIVNKEVPVFPMITLSGKKAVIYAALFMLMNLFLGIGFLLKALIPLL